MARHFLLDAYLGLLETEAQVKIQMEKVRAEIAKEFPNGYADSDITVAYREKKTWQFPQEVQNLEDQVQSVKRLQKIAEMNALKNNQATLTKSVTEIVITAKKTKSKN